LINETEKKMNGDKTNPYLVSPACQEVINKGYTSFDDCPVWALLEQVEAIVLNENVEAAALMISSVRERLPKLIAKDMSEEIGQYNAVMTKEDWESHLEWLEEQKDYERLTRQIVEEQDRETEDLI
jgi:hypothetical protein